MPLSECWRRFGLVKTANVSSRIYNAMSAAISVCQSPVKRLAENNFPTTFHQRIPVFKRRRASVSSTPCSGRVLVNAVESEPVKRFLTTENPLKRFEGFLRLWHPAEAFEVIQNLPASAADRECLPRRDRCDDGIRHDRCLSCPVSGQTFFRPGGSGLPTTSRINDFEPYRPPNQAFFGRFRGRLGIGEPHNRARRESNTESNTRR